MMSFAKKILIWIGILYVSAFGAEALFHLYLSTSLSHHDTVADSEYYKFQEEAGKRVRMLLASNPSLVASLRPAHLTSESVSFDIKKLAKQTNFLPLGGVPYSQTVLCDEGYGVVTYLSDRYGFRNDDSVWDEPVDWLLIGDSFVHGFCVHNGSTISDYVSKGDKGRSVINVGMGGNDAIHHAIMANTFIPAVKPSKVAIIFYPNDFVKNRFLAYEELYLKSDFQNPYLNLNSFNHASKKFYDGYLLHKKQKKKSVVVRMISRISFLASLPRIKKLYDNASPNYSGALLALERSYDLCSVNNCEIIAVYLPNSDYWQPYYDERKTAQMRNWLKSITTRLNSNDGGVNVTFVDLSDDFKQNGRRMYGKKGGHLSLEGNQMVALKLIEAAEINQRR